MQMIFRLVILLISAAVICGCSPSPNGEHQQSETVSIAYLKSLCKGDHYRIVNNYSIKGIIVATDWLGELYKSAIIVDETGGLEFAIDSHNINERLPVFTEVTINCNGLMLARIGSKIELGMPPTGDFPLDNIDDVMFDRYIRVVGASSAVNAPTKLFSEIGVADISNLVRFENVRICDEEQGLAWCDLEEGKPITTFRTLVDRAGERFAVRILSTCHYAEEDMPTKEISVIGVIDYSDNRHFLRIVNKAIL